MPQEGDLLLTEITLYWFELQSCVSQPLQHQTDVLQVVLKRVPYNNNVVEVHQAAGPFKST